MRQIEGLWLSISFGLLLLASSGSIVSQNMPCGLEELKASLPATAEVYSDARALSETLDKHGILVKCVLSSKMTGTFEGQTGAALYRTNHGDFEAIFLPQSNTFDQLKVVERQNGHWHIYSFTGPPQPWPANRIESPRRMYFVKRQNILFVLSDKQLAAKLGTLVRSH